MYMMLDLNSLFRGLTREYSACERAGGEIATMQMICLVYARITIAPDKRHWRQNFGPRYGGGEAGFPKHTHWRMPLIKKRGKHDSSLLSIFELRHIGESALCHHQSQAIRVPITCARGARIITPALLTVSVGSNKCELLFTPNSESCLNSVLLSLSLSIACHQTASIYARWSALWCAT
jgi:hypothetical protein